MAKGWALPNRLAHTAGSFLIRSCREISQVMVKSTCLEIEWHRKTNVRPHRGVLWEDQESNHQGEVNRPQQRRQTEHERNVETGGTAHQHVKEEGSFAATPPLKALRMLLSSAVAGNQHKVLMFSGISRAFMHARTASDVYVEFCEEDKTEPRDEHRRTTHIKSMNVLAARD